MGNFCRPEGRAWIMESKSIKVNQTDVVIRLKAEVMKLGAGQVQSNRVKPYSLSDGREVGKKSQRGRSLFR